MVCALCYVIVLLKFLYNLIVFVRLKYEEERCRYHYFKTLQQRKIHLCPLFPQMMQWIMMEKLDHRFT
jgi:hypothetical protein